MSDHLTQKIHVDIEEFLAGVARAPRRVPAQNHVVLGRDVHAIEGLASGVEYFKLLVGADLVDEDELVVSDIYEMIAVERDVHFAIAADRRVFAENVNDADAPSQNVITLQFVAGMIVQSRVVPPRPSGLARSVDFERQSMHVEAGRPVIQPEVALMDQDKLRAV